MLRALPLVLLLAAGCGALQRPGTDGGTGGGSGGGTGGGNGQWLEVVIDVPTGTTGEVQSLQVRPGEVWALVGNQYVVRSLGGRFTVANYLTEPWFLDLELTSGGRAVVTTGLFMLTCTSGCSDPVNFDEYGTGGMRPLALCTDGEELDAVLAQSDGGASLFRFSDPDGGWRLVGEVALAEASDCVVSGGERLIAGRGGVATVGGATAQPDVSATGRSPAQEPWTRLVMSGGEVFASSLRGAVARRSGGAWTVQQVFTPGIDALAASGSRRPFAVATGGGVAEFDGASWSAPIALPPGLAVATAAALTSDGVLYVGGRDSAGVPRIFQRAP